MAVILVWCVVCGTSAAERFFVDGDATGLGSGLTWEDAFVGLQPALDTALAGDEIWVACATYAPTERTDELDPRSARFEVRTGVSVFGGFLGGEENLEQRNPDPFTNGCVLGGIDDATGFFQLVHINNVPDSVVIDGFSFTQSTNLVEFGNRGVGIEVLNSSLNGRNLLFSGLTTAGGFAGLGGAVFAENSDVELEDTVLRDVATGRGGIAALSSTLRANRLMVVDGRAGFGGGSALYSNGSTEIEVFDGIFERGFGNNNGGAILADNGVIRLERCTFSENSARSGGAIFARSPAQVLVNNSTFIGNRARSGRGGAVLGSSSNPLLITNATFALNEAGTGSGIFVSGSGGALVQNTILFGNFRRGDFNGIPPQQIEVDADATGDVNVTYSLVQGGFVGEGNIDADPQFVVLPDPGDGAWETRKDNDLGDVRLQRTSPAIDAGNSFADLDGDGDGTRVAADVLQDVNGLLRVFDVANVPDTGIGGPPVIDIGASEVVIEDVILRDGFEESPP